MSTAAKVLAMGIMAAFLTAAPAAWQQALADPFDVFPGKDSQVFRPESPGYLIKKNQDQVRDFMQVPAPPAEVEKKKEEKPPEKEQEKK